VTRSEIMTILFSFNELENKSKCPSRTRGYLKPRWANYTPKGDVRRWRGPPSAPLNSSIYTSRQGAGGLLQGASTSTKPSRISRRTSVSLPSSSKSPGRRGDTEKNKNLPLIYTDDTEPEIAVIADIARNRRHRGKAKAYH
jgi:hypothetical protein